MDLSGPMTLPKALLYAFVAVALLFLILPNFIVVPISFAPTSVLEFPPRGFSTQWYAKYFTQPGWLPATFTSFYVAILTMIFSVIVGSLAAYGLVRGSFGGKRALNAFFLFPIIIPTLITAIAIFKLFSGLRLTGTIFGFVMGHSVLAIPFVITIMTASLRGIDPQLESAARSLGASRAQTLWRVTFPIALPGIIAASLFAFLVSFDELLIALFLSSPWLSTLPKKLWDGIRTEITPTIAAISTLLITMSIIVLISVGLIRHYFEKRNR
jgi:putative spermidine/putrescine transport system permease protein